MSKAKDLINSLKGASEATQIIAYLHEREEFPVDALTYLSEQMETLSSWVKLIEHGGAKRSKIYQYIESDSPFAILSAYTSDQTHGKNQQQAAGLLYDLKQTSFVVILTRGEWQGQYEKSFFVAAPNWNYQQFRTVIQELAGKYNQFSFVVGGPDVREIETRSGLTLRKFERLTFDPRQLSKLAGQTKIKGKGFAFTEECAIFGRGPVSARQYWDKLGLTSGV